LVEALAKNWQNSDGVNHVHIIDLTQCLLTK